MKAQKFRIEGESVRTLPLTSTKIKQVGAMKNNF
jgi:hypothetical protein